MPTAPLRTPLRLADAVWPEVVSNTTILVPLGSLEQHGPHLPLDTDSVIATAVAENAAERLGAGVLVAPVVAYGSSGEHQDFPGTISVGSAALRLIVVELGRSLRVWADRVLFVNGHGGNAAALRSAVTQLRREGHRVGWVPCATADADAHAGVTETSLMLHLRPGAVRLDHAEPGESAPIQELLPILTRHGVRAVSENGVLGDPTGASASKGIRLLHAMAARVAEATQCPSTYSVREVSGATELAT
jgi:creatinine amidohydrolase